MFHLLGVGKFYLKVSWSPATKAAQFILNISQITLEMAKNFESIYTRGVKPLFLKPASAVRFSTKIRVESQAGRHDTLFVTRQKLTHTE